MYENFIAITNRKLVDGNFLEKIKTVCMKKPRALVLREKDLSRDEYLAMAKDVQKICREHGVPFIVHSFPDVAEQICADGLHMPLSVVDEHTEVRPMFGVSCHSMEDVRLAEKLGCTYVILGTIFETNCKPGLKGRGLDFVREICAGTTLPVYAIGGNYRCPDAKKDFPDFYDNVVLNASFTNGCQGIIDGAQGVLYGYDARCEILGTNGCIYLGNIRENSVTLCRSTMQRSEEYVNSWKYLFREAYLEEDCDFTRAVLEQSPPKVTAYDGKMAVLTVNAGNLSIREKRIVEINGDVLI